MPTDDRQPGPEPVVIPPGDSPSTTGRDPWVRVRGARLHNLRNIEVAIPRDCLVVFTGISGSGKSSLAFGTINAEAQRRYFESVAPYARRLIAQTESPQVDEITGLPPAVALRQRFGVPSARSTVGTVTTLSNLLRMLFSRAGSYPFGAPRLDSDAFSPNTIVGACPECHGLGRIHRVTESTLVPDPSLSIRGRAIAAWPGAWLGKNFRDILGTLGYDIDCPWRDLSQTDRDWILFTDDQPVVTVHAEREAGRIQRPYEGKYSSTQRYVLHTLSETKSATARRRMLRFVQTVDCPSCHGRRLRPDALAVTFTGHDIDAMTSLPLETLLECLQPTIALDDAATEPETGERGAVAIRIARDLVARITVLVELGLGYLTIARATPTLSAGELQRLRLATQLRSGLFGVVYILDEPSAGLHPAEVEPLLAVLQRLIAAGNSLFVVEHDMDLVCCADWIVDVGPGAGERGGTVLFSGPVGGLAAISGSATGRYLFGASDDRRAGGRADRCADGRTARIPTGHLLLTGITRHNLAGLDLDLPLGVLTVVTGVSGSGKTTLVSGALADVVGQHLGMRMADTAPEADGDGSDSELGGDLSAREEGPLVVHAEGLESIGRLVRVDQKPIGRTPRSNLATYTGLFDAVRKAFAATVQARELGFDAGRFSFNVAGGRCETCQGEGFVAIELLFLPGSYSRCPTCHGARYNPETLAVQYRGLTIAEVLDQTVDDAAQFFADLPAAARSLQTLHEVGLGYLRLGQPATELSGGEAQRIKLAAELQRVRGGDTLYLLDEPTSGLHPADVAVLMRQLNGLVDGGNTVVIVEHDLDVIAAADHVIDLGPGGGYQGGRIVVVGSPADVAAAVGSATGRYLATRMFGRSPRVGTLPGSGSAAGRTHC